MTSFSHQIMLSWGWSRIALAFLSGALGALAMPPFGLFPVLAVSFTVAIWLIDSAATGQKFYRLATFFSCVWTGWWWGFGYFLAGLWWLGAAFLVDADQFAWAMPLGVIGLPMALAFFPGLAFGVARLFWSQGAGRIFAFAGALALSEWVRGHIFTGFPWNNFGVAFGQNLWLMQNASWAGLYGLCFLSILIFSTPATLAQENSHTISRFKPIVLAGCLLAVLSIYGALRVQTALGTVAGVKLRIVQPNIPQDARFKPEQRDDIIKKYLDLSDRAASPERSGVADITHLVWPESAFPFLLHRDTRALAQIGSFLPTNVVLITGAAREGDPDRQTGARRFYNSIHVLTKGGDIQATYDKIHLVPFGEYLPSLFDHLLRQAGLREFVNVPGGFASGTRSQFLKIQGLPLVLASICYEAIFPAAVTNQGIQRAGVILNVTNDAWFGQTPGPYQHIAQARLRAVEQGIPMVRAANNGISAIINPYGQITGSLPLGQEGILDGDLPNSLPSPLYALWGNIFFWTFLFSSAISARILR